MDFGILIVTLLLVYALILFVTELLPYEITAISIMLILIFTGILTLEEALVGFANRAVITIAALFVVSAGLIRSGAVVYVTKKIVNFSGGKPLKTLFISVVIVALFSAFINNTPVVIIFIPIILAVASHNRMSPSKLLIPVSYASILAGSCTLIGTSNNILVSGLSLHFGGFELSMFELTPVGVPITCCGILFMLLFSQKFLPQRKTFAEMTRGGSADYMTELVMQSGSPLIGTTMKDGLAARYPNVNIFEVIKGRSILYPPYEDVVLEEGDSLLVRGSVEDVMNLLKSKYVNLAENISGKDFSISQKNMVLSEILITPNSKFVNETVEDDRFKEELGLTIIAVQRRGIHRKYGAFKRPLMMGDILLVQADEADLRHLVGNPNLMRLEGIEERVVDRDKAPIAITIMLGIILLASFNVLNITLLVLAGAALMVITRCLSTRTAYRSIDLSVLLLIIGTIALGHAMAKTGAAELYANSLYNLIGSYGPHAVCSGLLAMTIVMTNIMSSKATASIFVPLAISLAHTMGVNPEPFVMAICFGVNAPFASPVGFQTNMLVLGPGGYKFVDYLKLGIPLCLIVWILATLMIPVFWPFQ